jgi:hypothetical protein
MIFEIIEDFFEIMQVVSVVEAPRVTFDLVKELFESREEIPATEPESSFGNKMMEEIDRHQFNLLNLDQLKLESKNKCAAWTTLAMHDKLDQAKFASRGLPYDWKENGDCK